LVGQVVTALLLGIILIAFQTFSTTQQSSWAQSPDEFVQYARKVMEVVQGAGVKGSAVESQLTPYNIQVYSWTQGDCGKAPEFVKMACTKESARIDIYKDGEDTALRSFNGTIRGPGLEQFDVGASQKGYSSHNSDLKLRGDPPRTLLTQSIQAIASASAYYTCGPVNGYVDKLSLSAPEPTPDSLTDEQFKQITAQKEAEAARMDEEHKAAVESLAKNIVQALVTNGLCNMPSTSQQQSCPAVPLTQDDKTTATTTTTLPSSSFAQKESDLLVHTSSNNNNGDKPVQHATTPIDQIANIAANYESSSSSSAGAVYPVSPVSPQQPPTTSSSSPSSSPPRKPILFNSGPDNVELFKEKTFDKKPWKFTYRILEGQGLVLENIRAADQLHFESVSVPHFEVMFSNGVKKIVRFECGDFRSAIMGPIEERERKPNWGFLDWDILSFGEREVVRHRLFWQFEKVFDDENLRGTLTIDYDIVIRTDRTVCEFIGLNFGPNCFRFIPTVSFYWQAQPRQGETPQTVEWFRAYYRLDYGEVGIAIDKNENNAISNWVDDTGRLDLLKEETQFTGVLKGAEAADTFDNIHNAHPGQSIFAPMCRFTVPVVGYGGTFPPFDCTHIHWRWGGTGVMNKDYKILNWAITPNVDVMIDPFNDNRIPENQRGTPYLVPGQTIDVAVVKVKENAAEEEDPDWPFSPEIVNNEKIADTTICEYYRIVDYINPENKLNLEAPCELVSAEPVRIWYAATSENKNSDTFFSHGTYVIDLKGEYKITTALQNLRSDLELTKSNTMSAALDESNINEILAHLNQALADGYWVTDGTLVPVRGEKVFAELSKTVELMQQIKKNGQDPQTSQLMDAATSAVLDSILNLVLNTMDAGNEKLTELTMDAGNEKLTELSSNLPANDKSAVDNLVKQNEALNSSLMYYAAAVGETDLANSAQIIDNFRLSWNNTIVGLGEVFSALGIAPPAAIATSTTTTTTATTPTTNATAATTTNGTTTTPTTPTTPTTTLPSITAVTLHPDSVPQFFKCGETPDNGSPTLPGLDVQSSAYTAITDGDANTEILGKAIFDVTFSEPITNGPGPELRVYEIGNSPEPFNVSLFSGDILTQSIEYTASATGDTDDCGFGVNVAEIELSDFGLGEGGQSGNEEIIAITGIRVDNQGAEGCCTGADISDVVIVSPTAAATTITEDVPLPPEQQLQQQQQDDESDAEGEEQQQEGGEEQLALAQCDPSYPDVCIPPPPPDLNCGDDGVPESFQVLPPNPHGFDDEDNDGIGCETQQASTDTTELSSDRNDDDNTEPESGIEEDAEPEPSDSGDEDNEDDDTSEE
jgi:hypothetical protein